MQTPFLMLSTIAWRNLWRNYRRTLIMLLAISVGVWAMIWMTALMRGMVDQMIKGSINNLLGHIQIHAPAYRDDPSIVNSIEPPGPELTDSLNRPLIKAWTSRIRVPAVISSERESRGVTLVGIDPAVEAALSFLSESITQGSNLASADAPGVVIGRKLAERLETRLGKRIVLVSQDSDNTVVDRGFRITGIFEAELQATELAYAFVGRDRAQEFLNMADQVSEISLISDDYRNLTHLLENIQATAPDLEVISWDQVDPYTGSMLAVMDGFILVWIIVVFLALSFGLVNTLAMAVFERKRELGLLQALGMQPGYILLQVLIESVILLLLGLLAGNLLAWLSIVPIQDGIDLSAIGEGLELAGMSSILYPVVEFSDIARANLVVIVLGILASLLPALRAARHVPVDAITRP